MVVSKEWLNYPSIRKVIGYLAAKNGGYEYVSIRSLLTTYAEPIYYFCRFLGYNDPEILLSDIKSGKIDVIEAIQNFRLDLVGKGRAASSIRRYHAGIKRWLETNRVKIDWNEVEYLAPLPKRRNVVEDRMPTREELRKLMNAANLRMKVIIEMATSSGLRIGTLIGLKVEDLDFEADEKVVLIKVRPELSKTKIGHWALISDEARSFLEQYLETYKIKSGWVFPARGGGPMTYNAVQLRWGRLLRKTGLDMKSRNMHVLHLHTLRKWFRTRLESYLTRSQIEYLMGHLKKEYLDGSYFRPPSNELITSYKAAMHRLYILRGESPSPEDIRKKTLLDMARLLGFNEETIRKIENQLQYKTVDQVIEEIKRFKLESH